MPETGALPRAGRCCYRPVRRPMVTVREGQMATIHIEAAELEQPARDALRKITTPDYVDLQNITILKQLIAVIDLAIKLDRADAKVEVNGVEAALLLAEVVAPTSS